MESGKKDRLTVALLAVYLVILTWIIVFKMQFTLNELGSYRNINLIPLRGSVIVNGRLHISEIIQNILAFVPFGVYLSMLDSTEDPSGQVIRRILPIFCVSLTYEVMQYVLAVGASDITDLIGNTAGGAIGIAVFMCFEKIFGEKAVKILKVLAVCGTICLLILITLLIVANM